MFEKAIDTVGFNNVDSGKIWLKFIEMEKNKKNRHIDYLANLLKKKSVISRKIKF